MKKGILVLVLLLATACGYSSKDNEMIGQVKKVMKNTPLICPDYKDADISLGVIRNGVGSMSSQDIWVYVPDDLNFKILTEANQTGKLVKIKYDIKRLQFCVGDHQVTSVELVP